MTFCCERSGDEDRQDLLGHHSARNTTHYSAAESANLIEAANGVCDAGSRKTARGCR